MLPTTSQLLTDPAFLTPLGIIVLMALLLFLGYLVPKWQVKNLIEENQHLRVTVSTLTEAVQEFSTAAKAQTQTSELVATVMSAIQEADRKAGR